MYMLFQVLSAGSDDRTHQKKDICIYCDRYFKNKKVKAIHMLIYHDKEPYQCPCGKSFYVKGGLDFHRLNHTKMEEVLLSQSVFCLSFTLNADQIIIEFASFIVSTGTLIKERWFKEPRYI